MRQTNKQIFTARIEKSQWVILEGSPLTFHRETDRQKEGGESEWDSQQHSEIWKVPLSVVCAVRNAIAIAISLK